MEKGIKKFPEALFSQAVLFVLTELKKKNPTAFLNLISPPENLIARKIKWLKNEKSLKIFFDALLRHKLIDCEYDFFKEHFINTNINISKIIWCSNINELVHLFYYLRDEKIIGKVSKPHIELQENFLDMYGEALKIGSLRSLQEKGINLNKRESIIDSIIIEVLAS